LDENVRAIYRRKYFPSFFISCCHSELVEELGVCFFENKKSTVLSATIFFLITKKNISAAITNP